jgi:predicted flap endonuclease-1-like 5' DNA nuclease
MSKAPLVKQYYNNTSFSEEENVSLKSSFLHFGQTLAIAFNLLKKRFSNLFMPVLVWQLVLFIIYVAIQLALTFGAINNLEPGTLTNLPNPIDQQTLEINPAFQVTLENLLKVPAILGYLSAMGVLLIGYILASTWLDFKTTLMLNDKSDKLFRSGFFIGRFWMLILFLIVQSIVISSIIDLLDIKSTPAINLVLGLLSFVFSFVAVYIEVISEYINSNYLIEKGSFWKSFTTTLGSVKKYLFVDFLKHLISFIFLFVVIFVGVLVFGGLSLGLLFPLAGSTASNTGVGILLLIMFALVLFLAIVFVLFVSWLAKCFVYVSYYNLRMLQLYDQPESQSDLEAVSFTQDKEPTQTLEEKLMENVSGTKTIEADKSNNSSSSFVNIDAPSNPSEQEIQAMEEYNLMDVGLNTTDGIEIKPELTTINPSQHKILNDDTLAAKLASHQNDDLKMIEGIGPKISELLNQNGITTFAHLADTSIEELKAILEKGGSKFTIHNPSNWPHQAELARDGKMPELEVLKADLIRGM